jgi:hypothetical protein
MELARPSAVGTPTHTPTHTRTHYIRRAGAGSVWGHVHEPSDCRAVPAATDDHSAPHPDAAAGADAGAGAGAATVVAGAGVVGAASRVTFAAMMGCTKKAQAQAQGQSHARCPHSEGRADLGCRHEGRRELRRQWHALLADLQANPPSGPEDATVAQALCPPWRGARR